MAEISKKKVLFCITKSNWGGAQRYVYDLAISLPREFFDVAVVFGEGGELEEKLKMAGVRTIRMDLLQRNINLSKDLSVFFELLRIFKKERPDVVHLNSTKVGGIGGLVGRICHVPKIIFTAHGWAFNEKRSIFSKIMIAFLQWLTVILCHITIAVSQKTANQMLEFPFIKLDKIKVIYNGVNELDFYTREEARRLIVEKLDLNISAGALVELLQSTWIGTISELHYNKGVDVALTAFADVIKKYPKTALMIIGEGEERARLAEEIIKSNLSDHVFLVGFITDAKKYLKAFDIFTLTSRTEALPYALLEAGLAGLPIVASDVGGIPEIISSEEVGNLIPVGQNNSAEINNILAKALENLIKNPEQAKILGQNLKHLVTTDFSAEKMCTETFYLYV